MEKGGNPFEKGARRDIYDLSFSLLLHLGIDRLAAEEHAFEIHADNLVPILSRNTKERLCLNSGKNGRVANSIRTLLRVAAEREGLQAVLDVVEP